MKTGYKIVTKKTGYSFAVTENIGKDAVKLAQNSVLVLQNADA